ncbi:hypothetical protein JKP88DRAFT_172109 [Tribonema minus]|uniref:EF-hand domain-containing protein n=1 Tax=Tribonema minus TaxID=303371 RepID=A0A835YJT6_9STRA|nr:hypothetical protein JKP88DRAFT_172109 [Tribonema minus]
MTCFDHCEITVLRQTFKDLCAISGKGTSVDKETFLQYFPLPGLLGERLFAVFDTKRSGKVDFEEFVCGLAVTCRGDWDQKVDFIFSLYDVHGTGAVSREELTALVSALNQ